MEKHRLVDTLQLCAWGLWTVTTVACIIVLLAAGGGAVSWPVGYAATIIAFVLYLIGAGLMYIADRINFYCDVRDRRVVQLQDELIAVRARAERWSVLDNLIDAIRKDRRIGGNSDSSSAGFAPVQQHVDVARAEVSEQEEEDDKPDPVG